MSHAERSKLTICLFKERKVFKELYELLRVEKEGEGEHEHGTTHLPSGTGLGLDVIGGRPAKGQ